MRTINKGVYPAMLTPFDRAGHVDVGGLRALVRWYAEKGCQGVFAACLSSEIFSGMSLADRCLIARETVLAAPETMDVVVSGHIRQPNPHGLEELKAIVSESGTKTLVLIASCLADEDEDEDVVRRNLYAVMEAIPDVDLGIYECPAPYHRSLSTAFIRECAESGRFVFMKDTCCDTATLRARAQAVRDTRLRLFNANSPTLLSSVQAGAAGLCGVMANFHPELYVRLLELAETDLQKAEELQQELGILSNIYYEQYPSSAKAYLRMEGLTFASYGTRNCPDGNLTDTDRIDLQNRFAVTQRLQEKWL